MAVRRSQINEVIRVGPKKYPVGNFIGKLLICRHPKIEPLSEERDGEIFEIQQTARYFGEVKFLELIGFANWHFVAVMAGKQAAVIFGNSKL
jgi:hypothetical protein